MCLKKKIIKSFRDNCFCRGDLKYHMIDQKISQVLRIKIYFISNKNISN